MRWPLAFFLVTTALVVSRNAAAQDDDPWFGRDKALHFGASAALAGGGYGLGVALLETRGEALLLGAGLALTAGIGKEGLDAAGLGDPSWRDFTWDVAGTVVGLGLAWSLDLLLRQDTGEATRVAGPTAWDSDQRARGGRSQLFGTGPGGTGFALRF